MSWFLFILLSVVSLGGGLGVVVTRNVVHAALFLLVSLVAVAGLYSTVMAATLPSWAARSRAIPLTLPAGKSDSEPEGAAGLPAGAPLSP